MNILNDIPELVREEVITTETADRIRAYYDRKGAASPNRLFIVFGILGAILTGLGIILIIAHNWDDLSRTTQTFFAFLPLLVGQALCAFAVWKKDSSDAWRESASVFLFFAVGASISLVSQVYHIPGNLSTFLLTWMALCLPLVYVMRSSVTSLLYIGGITWYATQESYSSSQPGDAYTYCILLLLVLPHYYGLAKRRTHSNYITLHHCFVPLSVVITLGTVAERHEELLFLAYTSLFGLLWLIGNLPFFENKRARTNGYLLLGSLGTVTVLLILSFEEVWKAIRGERWELGETITSPEAIITLLLSLAAVILLYRQVKKRENPANKPMDLAFLLFIPIFFIGMVSSIAVVLTNLLILGIGIATIRSGAREDHLGILNYGLLIIATLIICRFFDTDLSFVARGILFVLVGLGFFALNYWTLQKRKSHEH